MFLISKYIIRTNIAPFLFGTLTVLFLFLFQFLLKYLDQLVGKGIDNWIIFQLIVLNIPWMLVLAVPMGILFAVLMSFGAMSSNYEVTIIKASGGSLIRMMIPILIFALFLSGFLFWFNDLFRSRGKRVDPAKRSSAGQRYLFFYTGRSTVSGNTLLHLPGLVFHQLLLI